MLMEVWYSSRMESAWQIGSIHDSLPPSPMNVRDLTSLKGRLG